MLWVHEYLGHTSHDFRGGSSSFSSAAHSWSNRGLGSWAGLISRVLMPYHEVRSIKIIEPVRHLRLSTGVLVKQKINAVLPPFNAALSHVFGISRSPITELFTVNNHHLFRQLLQQNRSVRLWIQCHSSEAVLWPSVCTSSSHWVEWGWQNTSDCVSIAVPAGDQ